jgi:hypothetical protein
MLMGKPRPPSPPDPTRVAAAETKSHRDTALFDAELNRVNEVTPYGSVTYESEPGAYGAPNYTRHITESDNQRQLRELQEQLGIGLGQVAQSQLPDLGEFDFAKLFRSEDATGGPLNLKDADALGGAYDASAFDPTKQEPFDLDRYNAANLGDLNLSRYDPSRALPRLDVSRFDPTRQQGLDLTGYDPSRLDPLALAKYDPTKALPAYDNTRFDPMRQPGLDLSSYNQAKLGGLDLNAYDPAKTLGDYSQDVEKRARELATRGLDEQFARSEESLRTRLANQGVEAGSDAFKAEMAAFNQGKGQAYAQAELAARDAARADRASMAGELGQGANLAAQSRADLLARMSQGAGLEQAQSSDALNRLLSSYGMYNEGRGVQSGELARAAELSTLERADLLDALSRGAELSSLMNQDALARGRTGYDMYMGARGQSLGELGRGAELAGMERADLLSRLSQGADLASQERLDQMNVLNAGFDQYNQARAAEMAEILGERQTNLSEQEADYQREYADKLARHQLPLQELMSIMSGTPVNPLNPGAVSTTRVQPTDVLGAYRLYTDARMNNFNQKVAMDTAQRERLQDTGEAFINFF